MSANHTILHDPNTLSPEELVLEYEKLCKSYKSLKSTQETDLQAIYELKRVIKISSQTEAYLG
jgi:hypothetical protein